MNIQVSLFTAIENFLNTFSIFGFIVQNYPRQLIPLISQVLEETALQRWKGYVRNIRYKSTFDLVWNKEDGELY